MSNTKKTSAQKAMSTQIALHMSAIAQAMFKWDKTKTDRNELFKIVNHGVRVLAAEQDDMLDLYGTDKLITLFETVRHFTSMLTPNELMQLFPVDKKYDDHDDCKNSFYTMRVLNEHGIDNPLGENVDDILGDYVNDDILEFMVGYMTTASCIYRAQTGKSFAEQFFHDNGIIVHTEQ
jgi:hypothetical protein